MQDSNLIEVSVVVNAPLDKVWRAWTEPTQIEKWAFASDDWQASGAENSLEVGGKFKTVMSAKDGSESFEFSGTYTAVGEQERIEYEMDEDGRKVKVVFKETDEGVRVTESFELESENSEEMQRAGWQAILDNFKKYVEES